MRFSKSIQLIVVLFSMNSFGVEVKVPTFMAGSIPDPKVQKGESYVYEVEGRFEPIKIVPEKTANQNVEDLVKSLFYAYQKDDQDFFFTLFSGDASASLKAIPKNEFEKMWDVHSARKNVQLKFYHGYKNGMLLGTQASNEKNPDIQFARKSGKSWVFDKVKIDDKDARANNIGLYATYYPMKQMKASLLTTFSRSDKFKILEAQVTEPYITLLSKAKDRWEVVGLIKDNNSDYSAWPDLNNSEGIIRVEVTDFTVPEGQKAELLVIESSYPITHYPLSLEKNPQFVY